MDLECATDRELISMALEGDSPAFEKLFMRYKGEILQIYNQKRLPSGTDADDLLQETFVKVYLNLERYDPKYTFGQWIFTIARNIFIDYTRRARETILSIDSTINPPSLSPTPEQMMIISQSNRTFTTLMDTLPTQYRYMIELRFFKEYSYEEISQELGLPLGTVKTQIHRARERLFKLISNYDTRDNI